MSNLTSLPIAGL